MPSILRVAAARLFRRPARSGKVDGRMVAARRPMMEALEDRRYLSRVVLDSFSVPSNGSSKASAYVLRTGLEYRLQASGTHTIARGRSGDAQFYQKKGTGDWDTLGVRLEASGVSDWGAYSGDHAYAAAVSGSGAKVSAKILDSDYTDNSGSLNLKVLGPEVFAAQLKVSDHAFGTNSAVGGSDLYIEADADGNATIDVASAVDLPDDTAGAFFVWKVTGGTGSAEPAAGDLRGGTTVALAGGAGGTPFKVEAGFDDDGNGTLDSAEVEGSVDVHLVRITQATYADVNNTAVGSFTATAEAEGDPLWVEGWHGDGARVSLATDLNIAAAAEHVLVKLTDVATGDEQTLTLAEVQTAGGIDVGESIYEVKVGFDDNMDGELDGSGGGSAASAATGGEFLAASSLLGEEEGILRFGLVFGPLGEGIAAFQAGVRTHDLFLLKEYVRGRTAIYNLTGPQHTAYYADNDVVAAIAKFDAEFRQHVDQKAAVLTQANPQAPFDFTPTYNTPGRGELLQAQDSVFSMGNGYFESRYTGTITVLTFGADGKPTKWRVSGGVHRFSRDDFVDPSSTGIDIQPGFPLHADRTGQIQEDRTPPAPPAP